MYGTPRDLHVLTHSFPTRRSSALVDYPEQPLPQIASGLPGFGPGNRPQQRFLDEVLRVIRVSDEEEGISAQLLYMRRQFAAKIVPGHRFRPEIGRAHV